MTNTNDPDILFGEDPYDERDEDLVEATVSDLPTCNFCSEVAEYDARMTKGSAQGTWAYFCPRHWKSFTHEQLGMGIGQKLRKA